MSNDPENFGDDEGGMRCEGCNVNLEDEACLCGPAGPRLGGVWTGENAKELIGDLTQLDRCLRNLEALAASIECHCVGSKKKARQRANGAGYEGR